VIQNCYYSKVCNSQKNTDDTTSGDAISGNAICNLDKEDVDSCTSMKEDEVAQDRPVPKILHSVKRTYQLRSKPRKNYKEANIDDDSKEDEDNNNEKKDNNKDKENHNFEDKDIGLDNEDNDKNDIGIDNEDNDKNVNDKNEEDKEDKDVIDKEDKDVIEKNMIVKERNIVFKNDLV